MAGPSFVTEHDPRYGEAVEVAPGIRRVTAHNPSKFTYLGTGTYLVGTDPVAIIDCGPRIADHCDAILRAVGDATVSHLLVTHTHGDHSPSTATIKAATGATTYGFGPHPPDAVDESDADKHDRHNPDQPDPDQPNPDQPDPDQPNPDQPDPDQPADDPELHRPDTDFVPDIVVGHGEVIEGDGFTFDALHTPGHISNHLCFGHRESNALFTGDHVMGWSTTIIPPPDGDMGDYMASLRLLLDRDDDVYYPTHGPAIERPREFVEQLIAHRLGRENQIMDLLGSEPKTIADLVAVMYAHVDKRLHKPAARSVNSHLVYLERQERITRIDLGDEPSVFTRP